MSEGKQHCPVITLLVPTSVAGGSNYAGRTGENLMMWAASHMNNCKTLVLQSLMAHMGTLDAVGQRFLDPTVFSSKSRLKSECMAFLWYLKTIQQL